MHGGPTHHHRRIRKLVEESGDPSIAVWDRIVWVVAFLGPLFTLPQLAQVWVWRETAGVSLWSWGAYTVFSFLWLGYSLVHREKILIVNYILWILVNGMVVLGVVLFQART